MTPRQTPIQTWHIGFVAGYVSFGYIMLQWLGATGAQWILWGIISIVMIVLIAVLYRPRRR